MRLRLTRSRIGKLALAILFAIASFMWAKLLTAQEADRYSFGVGVVAFNASVYEGTISRAVSSSVGGRVAFFYGNGTQIGVSAFYSSLSPSSLQLCDTYHAVPGESWGHYGIEAMAAQSFNTGPAWIPYLCALAGYAWLNPAYEIRTTTGRVVGLLAGSFYEIARAVDFYTAISLESHQFSQIDTPYGVIDNAVIWSLMAGIAIK